jgi:alanine racemase
MTTTSAILGPQTGPDTSRARAWIQVDAGQLSSNLAGLRAHLDGVGHADVGILPMVKADAYGLGAETAVETLLDSAQGRMGLVGWGVATVDEGLQVLRTLARSTHGVDAPAAGPNPRVQVFSPLTPEEAIRGWAAGLHLSLSDLDVLELEAAPSDGTPRRSPRVFDVEVDTGMGRAGLPAADAAVWADRILERMEQDPSLRWDGVFTHLHSADEDDEAQARSSVAAQLARFSAVRDVLASRVQDRGHPPLRWHVGNSAGVVRFPDLVGPGMGLVRPGISLYGGGIAAWLYNPRPVISVYARVTRVVDAPPGTTLGYGSTHRATGHEQWATLAIGYGDGLPRALSGRGAAILHGQRVPVAGRISMDMTVVEASGLPRGLLRVGDFACLLGTSGNATLTLPEIARHAGTIEYEILTGWTARLPRLWVRPDGALPDPSSH